MPEMKCMYGMRRPDLESHKEQHACWIFRFLRKTSVLGIEPVFSIPAGLVLAQESIVSHLAEWKKAR